MERARGRARRGAPGLRKVLLSFAAPIPLLMAPGATHMTLIPNPGVGGGVSWGVRNGERTGAPASSIRIVSEKLWTAALLAQYTPADSRGLEEDDDGENEGANRPKESVRMQRCCEKRVSFDFGGEDVTTYLPLARREQKLSVTKS